MIPSWFLSMWISNSATAAMMMTIVHAVISQLKESDNRLVSDESAESVECRDSVADESVESKERSDSVASAPEHMSQSNKWDETAKALCLSIAYAATCGGIATLTGTAPNLIMTENLNR